MLQYSDILLLSEEEAIATAMLLGATLTHVSMYEHGLYIWVAAYECGHKYKFTALTKADAARLFLKHWKPA